MDFEERQGFAQEEFVALDVIEMVERKNKMSKEEEEDFGMDNE